LKSSVDVEKKELQEALEVMRLQNQMLARRIEKSQQESQQQLEFEKSKHLADLSRLSDEKFMLNQQLMEAQSFAERRLQAEKEELLHVIRRMEQEKKVYEDQIQSSEELIRTEAGLLRMQRAEMEDKIAKLMNEKKELALRWMENETKTQLQQSMNEVADVNALKAERAELQQTLQRVEAEKNSLTTMLKEVEQAAQQHTVELVNNLEDEKRKMAEVLQKMETEKSLQAQKVLVSRESTVSIAMAISQQIEKERGDVTQSLQALESQRQLLAAQVSSDLSAKANRGQRSKTDRETLIAKLKEMSKKKEKIEGRLSRVEDSKALQEQLKIKKRAKGKEDLKTSVQKMRGEVSSSTSSSTAGSTKSNHVQSSALNATKGSLLKLSFRSLFEVMGGDVDVQAASSSSHNLKKYEINGNGYNIIRNANHQTPFDSANKSNQHRRSVHTEPILEESEETTNTEIKTHAPAREADPLLLLPAPHAAAAKGDMARLQQLQKQDKSLLNSFEQTVGRRPLFYAASYGRKECMLYLLELFPDPKDITAADLYGDTALHAAAATGHADCVEILLESLQRSSDPQKNSKEVFADVKNNLGMTPCHLASDAACLEVLYRHNANLTCQDADLRSPLFVACAMNREACAEFIVGCLDQVDASLLAKDRRGDTPLHAAACNGSTECLLLLLQYGIDPRTLNDEGLKAIDLAVQNKFERCKEILSEYHLHFCTSSEFDSVLFLATLKGHDSVLKARSTNQPYQIIRGSNSVPENKSLGVKKTSMFSLNGGKTLRMEKWGCWIAYHDPHSQQVFWYNHETASGQWEVPAEVVEMRGIAERNKDGFDKTLRSKMSMRLKRVGEWIQYRTDNGRTFYYNQSSGDFQWDTPHGDKSKQTKTPTESQWKPYMDESSGSVFWYNHVTQVSQWECPADCCDSSTSSSSEHKYCSCDDQYHDIVAVHNEDELDI